MTTYNNFLRRRGNLAVISVVALASACASSPSTENIFTDYWEVILGEGLFAENKFGFGVFIEKGLMFCAYHGYSAGQGGHILFSPQADCGGPYNQPYAKVYGNYNHYAIDLPNEAFGTLEEFATDACETKPFKLSDITFANLKGFECNDVDNQDNSGTRFGFIRDDNHYERKGSVLIEVFLYGSGDDYTRARKALKSTLSRAILWNPF